MTLGAVGIGFLTTIVGTPVAIACEGAALGIGLMSLIGSQVNKKLNIKSEMHEKNKVLADAKLNTISDHISKALKDDAVNEKLGYDDLQHDLCNLYKPIIDSQSGIKENLAKLENKAELAITLSNYPAIMDIPAIFDMKPDSKIISLGTIATNYLKSAYSNKKAADFTFGINSKDGKLYLGIKTMLISNNDITIDDKKYIETTDLWELLTKSSPDKNIYNEDDLENYKSILKETDAFFLISSSKYPGKPRLSRSEKYNKIIKPILEEITGKSGKRVIFLPRSPDALFEKLCTPIAAFEAGNTGVRNEAVSIIDELLRQSVLEN
ncbi:uncharacterized protein LOC136095104 [Hydra vulgaris]|uniref:uncharacterized protein LOC136095104 n=1 Tax=Hydra vulgaris TaxID=6087 RepID=UPI0032EA58DF